MTALLDGTPASSALLRLIDLSLKLTLLLAVLLIAVALMRVVFQVSAARRASLLLLGSSAVPLVVAGAMFDLGLVDRTTLWEIAPVAVVQAPAPSPPIDASATIRSEPQSSSPTAVLAPPLEIPAGPVAEGAPAEESQTLQTPGGNRLTAWLFPLWIVGIVLIAARLAIGTWLFDRRTRRHAKPIVSGRLWHEMISVADSLGLRRSPTLLLSCDRTVMPATWGGSRHRVLLPATAEDWDRERLRLVLYHELAHVKRRDCLAGWAMVVLLAPAWFHPLAWCLQRRATDLRENACDDLTAKGSSVGIDDYARALVSLSRRHQCAGGGSLAMARPQRLTSRILALYNPRVSRSSSSLRFRVTTAGLLAASVIPMVLVSACQTQAQGNTVKSTAVEIGASGRASETDTEDKVVTARLLEVRDYIKRAPRHRSPAGPPTLRDPVRGLAREWGLAMPEFAPGRALPIDATTDRRLRTNTHRRVHASKPFDLGSERSGLLFESVLPDSTIGKLRRIEIRDASVRAIPGNKLSVRFTAALEEDLGDQDAGGQATLKTRRVEVGPLTIENGGGLVLGVAGVDAYMPEPGILSFGRAGREMPYRRIKVLSFELDDRRPEFAPKHSITPTPTIKPGDEKVALKFIEVSHISITPGTDAQLTPSRLEQQVSEWTTIGFHNGSPQATSAEMMEQLAGWRAADSFPLPPFLTGKQYTAKVVREFTLPGGAGTRETGIISEVKVRKLASGKLEVELDTKMVAFFSMGESTDGTPEPTFNEVRSSTGKLTIENGGGIVLGLVREDVQQVSEQVPILGQVPLLGKLFRNESAQRTQRVMVVQVEVDR